MPKRIAAIRANDREVTRRARAMQGSIHAWLRRLADKHIARELRAMRTGRHQLKKADATDAELLNILTTYGLRHVKSAGKEMADTLGGEWRVPPQLVDAVIRQKKVKVKRITRGATEAVRSKIREVMRKAEREVPQPSNATIARRIRREVGDLHIFSVERAALIARTEATQNQSTGIYQGMRMAGVEEIEWLASGNPNHGDRRHDLMNGMTVKLGEKFTNPTTGKELRYPGDPQAHIGETANCGCTYAPAKIKRKRAA